MTYSEIKLALDEIAQRIIQNRKRIAASKTGIQQAAADLGSMSTQYAATVTAINALESDPANDVAKSEKDKLVAEFAALKAEADALVTALGE